MKRIVAIICIMFLLFTTSAPMIGSIFSYADEETFSDQQKQNLAVSTYVNSRNGWFTGSSPAAVIGIVAREVNNFYGSDSNTTTISSVSDFAEHITVSTDPLKVNIDSTGILFLNQLIHYIFGDGKYPNIYSNGAWGVGDAYDNMFNGYCIGNNLVYFYNQSQAFNVGQTKTLDKQYITQYGTPLDLTGMDFYSLFTDKYAIESWLYSDQSSMKDWNDYRFPEQGNLNVQFHRNFTYSYYVSGTYQTGNYQYPKIVLSKESTKFLSDVFYCNTGSYHKVGYFVNMMIYGRNTTLLSGFMCLDSASNNFTFHCLGSSTTTEAEVISGNVDFNIKDFDTEDPEGEQEYTPQYTTDGGNTYNNFTGGDTYNNYYNYEYQGDTKVVKKTYVEPETPGGTTPPWNGGDSGNINPDGNGGFNLNLPDLTIPDLNIDWNITGLKDKFPFSIPWDLMAFFTVLNAPAETPELQGQIDLGIVNWNIDWDLHDFDTIAALLRNLEFIGFCIALILVTRSIIKG